MRKLAVAAALASTALAGPALARDGTWYAGLHAGGLLVEDVDFDTDYDDESTVPNTDDVLSIDHEYGYDIDGVVGYDFGAFRGEFGVRQPHGREYPRRRIDRDKRCVQR
mgnify:CR=1 FL=1